MPASPNFIAPVVVTSLVAWRVYSRVRRNIGKQEVQPKRLIARLVIFGVVAGLILLVSLAHPAVLLGFGVGILLGTVLALVGLKLTHFERTADGHCYTPNTYVGVALSILLVGRIAYRLTVLYSASPSTTGQPPPGFARSPLTLAMFGLLVGYYFVYYIGLLLRCRKMSADAVQLEKVVQQ